MSPTAIIMAVLAFFVFITILKTAVVVPNQVVYVIERLGKYSRTLGAGFHILVPFIDRVAYRHILKEQAGG
jgi:regulator of protease activity HflC (stomatin/prohibitin superfamily)